MTVTGWVLLYLAVGAAYLAVDWHYRTEDTVTRLIAYGESRGHGPAEVTIVVALGLLMSLVLWPVTLIEYVFKAIRRRR